MSRVLLCAVLCVSVPSIGATLADRIIQCESSGIHEQNGRMRCNTHEPTGHQSCGIAQFREDTFYEFARMAHIRRPDWTSRWQQVYLLDWGLKRGYGRRWSCYRKLREAGHVGRH
jgi:hypothetical protein